MASAVPAGDLIVHFPPPGGWASQIIRAFSARRISAATMWELLLANADRTDDGPDVENLLAHLRNAYEDRTLMIESELG